MPPMYTSTHEILRPDTSASPPDGSVVMSVGLTSRAFDLIGDVRHVEQTFRHFVDIRGEIPEGVPLCLPVAAAVVAVNQAAISEAYKTIKADESGWIYKVRARPETMETARKLGLVMSEEQYLAMCDRQEEQEDAEASRSYP
jgi:glycine cleavage system H lipoate-binding protein